MNQRGKPPCMPAPTKPPGQPGNQGVQNRAEPIARSMHEDVPDWYDCCSCEAEPYWLEALGESDPTVASERDGNASNESPPPSSAR